MYFKKFALLVKYYKIFNYRKIRKKMILEIVGFILVYLFLSYSYLTFKENQILKMRKIISILLDKRFRSFEILINKVEEKMDYEQTFLKEIVQLRSQAQKFKQEKEFRSEYFCEERITQLALKIELLFAEFPELKSIANYNQIIEEILISENNLLPYLKKYNSLAIRYNKAKSSLIHLVITQMFSKFDNKIELWKLEKIN